MRMRVISFLQVPSVGAVSRRVGKTTIVRKAFPNGERSRVVLVMPMSAKGARDRPARWRLTGRESCGDQSSTRCAGMRAASVMLRACIRCVPIWHLAGDQPEEIRSSFLRSDPHQNAAPFQSTLWRAWLRSDSQTARHHRRGAQRRFSVCVSCRLVPLPWPSLSLRSPGMSGPAQCIGEDGVAGTGSIWTGGNASFASTGNPDVAAFGLPSGVGVGLASGADIGLANAAPSLISIS